MLYKRVQVEAMKRRSLKMQWEQCGQREQLESRKVGMGELYWEGWKEEMRKDGE